MDWQVAVILAVITFGFMILWHRVEPRLRRWFLLILVLPTAILIYRWSRFRQTWIEIAFSIGAGTAAFFLWWWLIGRKLPPPRGSQIRVITEDEDSNEPN